MAKNTFLVTTTKISLIHVLSPLEQALPYNPEDLCSLKWKLKKLLVKHELFQQNNLAALENFQWLINCLNHSSTQAVCIDLELGNEALYLWADACQKSKKTIFIRVPSHPKLPQILYPFKWRLKSFIDRLASTLLIFFISPILILLTLLIFLTSSGPIFSLQWCVGQRGRLFKVINFCTTIKEKEKKLRGQGNLQEFQNLLDNPRMTRLGCWMRRYKLDLLPQLANVLKGDMSIVGPKALNLYEAKNIDVKSRSCLRALPGITGSFSSGEFSSLKKMNMDNNHKLNYLSNWSLLNDFKILTKHIFKAFW